MHACASALFVAAALLMTAQPAVAQSGSSSRPAQPKPAPHGSSAYGGSTARQTPTNGSGAIGSAHHPAPSKGPVELAMRGFCPVTLAREKQWAKGDPKLTLVYDGRAYQFASARHRQMFRAAPAQYAPALGGDNVVRFAKTGQRVPGNLLFGALVDGRIYFVDSEAERQELQRHPTAYADVDLAMRGQCVVCRVELDQAMPGAGGLTVTYQGLRYRFAGVDQQRKFLQQPERYSKAVAEEAPRMNGPPREPAGSDLRTGPVGSGAGRSGSGSYEGS